MTSRACILSTCARSAAKESRLNIAIAGIIGRDEIWGATRCIRFLLDDSNRCCRQSMRTSRQDFAKRGELTRGQARSVRDLVAIGNVMTRMAGIPDTHFGRSCGCPRECIPCRRPPIAEKDQKLSGKVLLRRERLSSVRISAQCLKRLCGRSLNRLIAFPGMADCLWPRAISAANLIAVVRDAPQCDAVLNLSERQSLEPDSRELRTGIGRSSTSQSALLHGTAGWRFVGKTKETMMTSKRLPGAARFCTMVAVPALVFLSACGGDGNSGSPSTTAAAVPLTCAQINGKTVAASAIGLPTSGATVTSATVMPATGSGATAVGAYCLVTGTIAPVDTTAPNIGFNIALPVTWNQKIMMFGGGGTDGSVPAVTGTTPQADPTVATPLGRGYATFASDSGHQNANSADSSWTVNQEANLNFMGDALKKTHDVALSLIDTYYAVSAPKKAYFAGGSTGGREALTVAQRWPADWDGVIAFYPAWDYTALTLGQLNAAQAFAAPGAWMDAAKRGVLFNAALAACDALDGIADGVISNVQACLATFDPSTAMLNGAAVRCAGGADTGEACLSDAQIAAVKSMNGIVQFNTTLASGESSYPGYNALIADLGIPSSSPYEPIINELALGAVAPAFPVTAAMMFDAQIAGSWTQYTVVGDASYDPLTFPISAPGAFASRLSYLSSLDAIDTNLTPFAAKGGKLLIMHGTADVTVSPRATEEYVSKLQATMGVNAVAGFLRFYEVPGFQHAFSTVFNPAWDNLTELENWVEAGTTPPAEVVMDTVGVAGRTRPLCVYPTWPKYSGSGDVNVAASFTCSN